MLGFWSPLIPSRELLADGERVVSSGKPGLLLLGSRLTIIGELSLWKLR